MAGESEPNDLQQDTPVSAPTVYQCVVAVVSDIHIGSTVGLCPPEAASLDDGGGYLISKVQRWLWECWLDFWRRVHSIPTQTRVAVWCGDLLENIHHATTEVWSMNQADWFKAAEVVIGTTSPVRYHFFLRGTGAHDGEAGQLIEACVPNNVVRDPTGNRTWWHLPLQIGRTLIEFSHFGRVGQLPWTRSAPLNRLRTEIIVERQDRGGPIPDVVCIGHRHTYAVSEEHKRPVVISLPGWQIATSYGRSKHPFWLPDIGGLILRCDGHRVEREIVLYNPQEDEPWKLPKAS